MDISTSSVSGQLSSDNSLGQKKHPTNTLTGSRLVHLYMLDYTIAE